MVKSMKNATTRSPVAIFRIIFVVLYFFAATLSANAAPMNNAYTINEQGQRSFDYISASSELFPTRAAGTLYESEVNDSSSAANMTYDDYDNFGRISTASDVDWWVVKFSASGYANFWIGNIPTGCDYDMRLYGSDGSTLLKVSLNAGNADELISEYWVTANTYYFIRINSYSGYSNSSYYKFRTKNYQYHQYAGFYKSGSNKGISASIKTPSTLPNVSDSAESAWVSTSKDANGQWIQTGVKYGATDSGFVSYTEHFQNGVYKKRIFTSHPLNTAIQYKVEYSASDQKWHAYISGVDKISSALSNSNTSVQCYAEIHKKLIELGPFTFSNVQIKSASGIWAYNTVAPSATSPYSVSGSASNFTVSGP